MNTENKTIVGTLNVQIDSDSMYFRRNVPIEIRDHRMRLIQKTEQDRLFKLAPGLYQVSAVLEDGQEHKHFVKLRKGETENITMGANTQITKQAEIIRKAIPEEQKKYRPRYTKTRQSLALESVMLGAVLSSPKTKNTRRKSKSARKSSAKRNARSLPRIDSDELEHLDTVSGAFPDVEAKKGSEQAIDNLVVDVLEQLDDGEEQDATDALISLSGAHRIEKLQNPWMIKCDDQVSEVPTARVKVENDVYVISLPTSPHDSPAYNSCVVTLENRYSVQHVVAWISPDRTVANAIQNMMVSNEFHSARAMAGEATELLRAKYRDPTGATLGALVLHKFGLLSEKQNWLENLTRDFNWIPDAKILLAATMIGESSLSGPEMKKAFKLAIEASKQRVLYTENFSILLDMLRRWPDENQDQDERKEAIKRLAHQSPAIDWNSICMSIKQEE
ncbi:MAG: hypothetical protein ACRBHB_21945 [Arenicella sp.]